MEDTAEGTRSPPATFPRGGDAHLHEAAGQGTQRQVLIDMPAKDLSHPPGGRLVDLDGRRQTPLSWDAPIAVGDSPVDRFPLPEPKQLAPPVALGDLRALILG